MSTMTIRAGGIARRLYERARRKSVPEPVPQLNLEGQPASDLIRGLVTGEKPAMIARLGAIEMECLLNYAALHPSRSLVRRVLAGVRGDRPVGWSEWTLASMTRNAGFFPPDPALLDRFAERMLDELSYVDVLGSWLPGEAVFRRQLGQATTVSLPDLEPYYHETPWTEGLTGRTVLVVHPFEETIRSQYQQRALLFDDPRVLPDFELKTLKAVQSIAGTPTPFRDWFEALQAMESEISASSFDVALLGCGAYGFPLAAHVKRLGRRAVHLGGACQILFGIKGRRWDDHEVIAGLYNEHWVRPSDAERPTSYGEVEEGCYW